jgi:uncharacterized protein (DUF433 family)
MPTLEEVRSQFEALNYGDQEELLSWLGSRVYSSIPDKAFPSIVSTPETCGGEPRFIRTRIPVWCVERLRQLGATEEVILASYPRLAASDLVQAWAYVAAHREEIERQIRENEEDEEE